MLRRMLKMAYWMCLLGVFIPSNGFSQPLCTQCLSVRLGRPLVVRGPAADELDSTFNEIKLASGLRRGFSSNAISYAIDSTNPWNFDSSHNRTPVLTPGNNEAYDSCGRWLNSTKKTFQNTTTHGFIHSETECNYPVGQTHKSMAYARSTDEGLSWSVLGQIISGTDTPRTNAITGEGDCTVIDGKDSYFYGYCLRAQDWRTIVARAPVSTPEPGNWVKYFNGAWSEPGLGGNADSLGFLGTTAGHWVDNDSVFLLGSDKWFGGLKASFSTDKVSFTTMAEPLIPLDDENWIRPAPTELITYPSVMNFDDGSNQIGSHFILTYVYIQPGEGFDKRYLVFRDAWITQGTSSHNPQVGITLTRWYSATNKDRWTTTAPVPGNSNGTYSYDKDLGFLMTKPHATLPVVKLEDCVSNWPGHPDHLLTNDGTCAPGGYTRLRTAGWVFRDAQPGTVPVYRCYSPTDMSHFASNQADCEGLGSLEWRLGYALSN